MAKTDRSIEKKLGEKTYKGNGHFFDKIKDSFWTAPILKLQYFVLIAKVYYYKIRKFSYILTIPNKITNVYRNNRYIIKENSS